MGGFEDALTKVRNSVADLTTVDVLTFTGEVVLVPKNDPGGRAEGSIDWSAFQPSPQNTAIKLVAATHVELDFDTVNFRTSETALLTDDLLALHKAATEAALNGRAALLKLFLGALS